MNIAIIDYGMGNLHSVYKSVQAAADAAQSSAKITLTSNPENVLAADKVIFPGQGAMPDCMNALNQSGLREAVQESLKNKPFFGICVGAQLLFEHSEEGDTAGLGWFKGSVKRFATNQTDTQGNRLKVPHMGWNTVRQTQAHPLFAGVSNPAHFYFVQQLLLCTTRQRHRARHKRISARFCLHCWQRQRVRHTISHRKKPRSRLATVAEFLAMARLKREFLYINLLC